MSKAWEGWAESQQGHTGDTHSTWVPANPVPHPLFFCLISLAWCTPFWHLGEQPGLFTPKPKASLYIFICPGCFLSKMLLPYKT